MNKLCCDICGEEITYKDPAFHHKIKKMMPVGFFYQWDYIDCHVDCFENLCREIKRCRHGGTPCREVNKNGREEKEKE